MTVVFCDLTGSTALGESLDPERLRALLGRYFDRMRGIVERHGGSVEKFIGDAVMAVFGVPQLHEDDALRAVRAAAEMRDAVPELGLQARIGVMTGEVVTGTEERLATGDAVNVAARLEQAAAPGEVLIGQPTFQLVGESVEVESVEPLALKGKAEPVPAYRLVAVRAAPERRHDSRFVGRARELELVRAAWARAQEERRCELVTIVGTPGVGKTRLVAELLASVEAQWVRGRCLPYGEGITYWPVVEVLKQLGALPPDETAAAALRSLLGESEAATSADEIAWAFRKLLEHAALQRPLLVVFDDIHWGEETFLDLVEHVALLSSGAPILLLCIARPELSDRRPSWPITLRLEPLDDGEVADLIPDRLDPDLREQIVRAAGGNPLFIGEMLAMAADTVGEVTVPPTLQALLAARLDQLELPERSVLERAAVEGEIFHRGAVQALDPADGHVMPRLASLARKELIRPDATQLVGEDGFRFRHLLVRDTAYDGMPKALRAELHERFAEWLEQHGAGLVELDEILGHHLEQAHRYREELGIGQSGELAAAARRRLHAAGSRASVRSDHPAAVNILARAAALVPATEIDLAIEIDLVEALFWGGDGDAALRRARSYTGRARETGDGVAELCGRIQAAEVLTYREPEGATDRLADLVEEAIPVFQAQGHDLALYVAHCALGQVANVRGRPDTVAEEYDRAYEHARRAGLPHQLVGWRATGRLLGSTPVKEFLTWLDEQDPGVARNAWVRAQRAEATAMLGHFDEARAAFVELRSELAERGEVYVLSSVNAEMSVDVELRAGNPSAAVQFGEAGCRSLEETGDRAVLSTMAGKLAQALFALGRIAEAETWAARGAELGASDDAITQMLWRQVRAKVLASRGESAEAERLAREAVSIGAGNGQMLVAAGDAYADLGEVLSVAGNTVEAVEAYKRALSLYERKGNLASADTVRRRLDELGRDPSSV